VQTEKPVEKQIFELISSLIELGFYYPWFLIHENRN